MVNGTMKLPKIHPTTPTKGDVSCLQCKAVGRYLQGPKRITARKSLSDVYREHLKAIIHELSVYPMLLVIRMYEKLSSFQLLRTFPPKSSKVGAFLPRPPPFRGKISVSGHQKSRKGTNPIRPNDVIPSFHPIKSSIFVYIAPYSDVLSVKTRKNYHPSFVSKLGRLYME